MIVIINVVAASAAAVAIDFYWFERKLLQRLSQLIWNSSLI